MLQSKREAGDCPAGVRPGEVNRRIVVVAVPPFGRCAGVAGQWQRSEQKHRGPRGPGQNTRDVGWISTEDCDDGSAAVNPGAGEICEGLADEDCDGSVDELPAEGSGIWYADTDGDGFGDGRVQDEACAPPPGFVSDASDCDDTDGTVFPDATEIAGDEVDQNCDGNERCYEDADGDGYRSEAERASEDVDCGSSGEARGDALLDCDDSNPTTHPGAEDPPGDLLDQDCSGADTEVAAPAGSGCGCTTGAGGGPRAWEGLLVAFALWCGRRARQGGTWM